MFRKCRLDRKRKFNFKFCLKKLRGKIILEIFCSSSPETGRWTVFFLFVPFNSRLILRHKTHREFFFGCVTPVIPPKLPQQPTHDKQIYFKTTKQFSVNLTSSKHTHTRKKSWRHQLPPPPNPLFFFFFSKNFSMKKIQQNKWRPVVSS